MRKGFFVRTAGLVCLMAFAALPASAQMFGGDSYRAPAVSQPGRLEWAWDGSDRLAVGVPATVRYSEQGAPRLIITGPDDLLRRVRFRDGSISNRDEWGFSWSKQERLEIQVTGVKLKNFLVSGSARMLLGKLDRDSINIRVSGSGSAMMDAAKVGDISLKVSGSGNIQLGTLQAREVEVEVSGSGSANAASGNAESIDLSISGSGSADFGGLKSREASVNLSGSGQAAVAPRDKADIRISGSGSVRMPTSPPNLQSRVSGSGRITTAQADIR
ncbi:MAG: DUF2807 domain-containing protein [Pseudomonadota bacterium]